MNSVSIPLHLLIPTILSLAGLILLLWKRRTLRRKNYVLYKSAIIFFSAYVLIVGNALGHDLYYQWEVNSYHLNQHGILSIQTETIPQQELARQRLLNDAARNNSFISGLIVSAALSISVYILMRLNQALFGSAVDNNKTNIFV